MHPPEVKEEALRWVAFGLNDCQISRLMSVPRGTIRDWRKPKYVLRSSPRVSDCPTCDRDPLDERAYAYLLGLYLGDGYISEFPRAQKLRITLDQKYPFIINECRDAIAAMRPQTPMRVGVQALEGCVEVWGYWQHWTCVFPHHGPGPKHKRKIELRPWQKEIVRLHPDRLLRGLIHSDGWRGNNRVAGKDYPRYQFTNHSADIRGIFCDACDAFGVRWRQMNWRTISIARAPEVAKLDAVIGLKR